MLKNKMKFIALLLVMILSITIPFTSLAHNETEENSEDVVVINEEEATSEEAVEVEDTTFSEDNFKKSDIYLFGDDITIDYIVDGNLFVIANNVTINSQIGGDAFICANSITITDQGYIFSNLFSVSDNLEINGVVYDLYTISQNTTINGYIYRDVRIAANTINIYGTVGRNVFANCANINFVENEDTNTEEITLNAQGMIGGNLNYTAKQEISIPEGAVSGDINFEKETITNTNVVQDYIMSLGTFVVTVIIIWLLCLWITPKFLEKTSTFLTTKKVLPAIGFGILAPIVLAILSIVLLILGLTSTIGLLLLTMLFVFAAISTSVFVISANNVICNKLKIQKKIGTFGMLILSAIVLWAVSLIPYVGSIIGFIMAILGFGIIVSSLVLKEKAKKEIEVNEE